MLLPLLKLKKKTTQVVATARGSTGDVSLSIDNSNSHDVENVPAILALIEIPTETFPSDTEIIHSFYYKKASLFTTGESLKINIDKNKVNKRSQYVQSVILSVSFGKNVIENLTSPIILTFKKVAYQNKVGEELCSFWDFNLRKWLDIF